MPMPGFRMMEPRDIPIGLHLCRSAGWNQIAGDWACFLELHPEGVRLFEAADGHVAGTVATICYERKLAWIGMLLVDPAYRNQGIGTALLKEAMRVLADVPLVKLDATPAGRAVYRKLDFVDEYPLWRMAVPGALRRVVPSLAARAMERADLPMVYERDKEIFGADRHDLLRWMHDGAPQLARVAVSSDELLGYCFGRKGFAFTQLGPIVAADTQVAMDLVQSALHQVSEPVVIDVISFDKPEWFRRLRELGFSEQRPFMRMYNGVNQWPGQPADQYAILGPEFG